VTRRPKGCRLADAPDRRHLVQQTLPPDWSPVPMAGWLKRIYPDDPAMYLSHATLYHSLYGQARGVLKKELIGHLRRRHPMRR